MINNRFAQMVLMAIQRLQDPYYQGFAAQAAFYYMMSIVPLIIVLSQMLNIFNISTDFIQEIVSRYLPGVIGDSLSGWLTQSDNTTTSIVHTIVALWAASRAQFSMTRITNYTMSGGKSTGKGYFQERFRALFTIFVTIIALSFGLVAVVFGEQILYAVLAAMKMKLGITYEVSGIWMILRWVFSFIMYLLMVFLNSIVSLTEKKGLRSVLDMLPGSIFSAVGMLLVTLVYARYTNYAMTAGNYNIIYGSLATIVALLFWFYFISWVQCLGVLFNKVWLDTGAGKLRKRLSSGR